MDRRYFIRNSGIAVAGFGMALAAPESLQNIVSAVSANRGSSKKTLVVVFQRGAVDGLSMIPPYGEKNYVSLRRGLAVPRPGSEGGAIDLDGFFGLHPSMSAISGLWRDKSLAVVHSAGSPDNTRSHFDAQDYMESGTPGVKSTRDGWMNRLLQSDPKQNATPFRAVAMTQQVPRTLVGRYPTVAMTNLQTFAIRAGSYSNSVSGGFEDIWKLEAENRLGETGKETFEAIEFLKKSNPSQYRPSNGARYPAGRFGDSMRQVAQLIKAGVGLETAFTDTPGLNWDTHANQANGDGSRGQLANLFRNFGQTLGAFAADLGPKMEDVLVVTMSEFGRTVRENGTRGTDHGHGNAMLLFGGGVNGGKVYGEWRGLSSSELHEGRDLAVTTDYRDVLIEVGTGFAGIQDSSKIFPGYKISRKLGIFG
ncbi:MAG: DUF1501 domain-containing protein [Acidobacteria bacterium]|nr:MAG: DUF1501 domain-containing protein [Acidobacteriota bacterium]REJ99040.1 MAG: DUF1501 domain-containing protein [Acidobacteriota bacterium]REK16239.1 MAG: DUF1501 domain-containing protein [Acidobacteriota bacterium]REK43920.1 MAG: DUF1501 domain-containing protein [Acidobacteriota bacterium]